MLPTLDAQWSLVRPPVVQGLVWATTLTILISLAVMLPWLALILIWGVWRCRHHPGWGLCNPAHTLCCRQGVWQVLGAAGRPVLSGAQLIHAWQGHGWVALRLRGFAPSGRRQTYDASVWRAGVSVCHWRQMRRLLVLLAASARPAGGSNDRT